MYDILQLNDMLVPELLDIAEQLKIPNAKKLNKQDLVYKIDARPAVLRRIDPVIHERGTQRKRTARVTRR